MLLEILDRDVAHSTLHHLHGGQGVRLLTSPQLPDPVEILLPIDPVHVLEVSVHGVSIVLDHLAADLTFEGLGLGLAPTESLLILPVRDVVFVLDVAVEGAVVIEHLGAQGAVEELLVSAESGAVTIAGTPADNDLCYFRVGRDVSGDAMAGDARLHGIKLFYTTDAVNDA